MRYREDLTQAQLAAMVGVKPSHISDMENGKRSIGKEMAKRLAKALNSRYKGASIITHRITALRQSGEGYQGL